MKDKILITGGSGFIGTNLIEFYFKLNYEVINFDIQPPQNRYYNFCWRNVDVNEIEKLKSEVLIYDPNYIIHLAARTDLDGKSINEYKTNILGVSNLIECANECSNLIRMIITSSMLVCKLGYIPTFTNDYSPSTRYGESKVLTEKITFDSKISCEWSIIRPTSIWGPWFKVPYRNFFDMVLSGYYFHIGNKSCTKTYGYIDNAIYQINQILFDKPEKVHKKVFYIGDYIPYNIEDWSNEIANQCNLKIRKLPYFVVKSIAVLGDIIGRFGIKLPMSSFRLKNMTTNNIVDLSNIMQIAPELPFSRIEGVQKTLKWIKTNN